MMNSQDVNFIKKTGKIRINILDLFLSYIPIFFGLVVPWFISIVATISDILSDRTPHIVFAILSLVLSIVLGRILISIPKKLKLLKVTKIDIDYTRIDSTLIKTFNHLNWSYSKLSENEYVASTPISLFSWGEMIYIINYEGNILMTSLGRSSPITFGKNRKNHRNFKRTLKHFLKD